MTKHRGLSADLSSDVGRLNVGIVHEWLTNDAGSERCVAELRRAFDSTAVYASVFSKDDFPTWSDVSASFLQRAFGRHNGHLRAGPLLPLAMRSLRPSDEHDLLIYSFHHFSTWAPRPRNVPAIVYCYTPPRFAHRAETLRDDASRVVRAGVAMSGVARRLDRRMMMRLGPQRVVADSRVVAARMEAAYGRPASVIHPPVEVASFAESVVASPARDYFLLVGRLVPYKNPSIVIDAFRSIDRRLVVVGEGRMEDSLKATAPKNVEFRGRVGDAELRRLYAGSAGLIFPAEEDFGIVPVEAMAAGCPVLALNRGGVLDYLNNGVNGLFMSEESVDAIRVGVADLEAVSWDRRAVSESVQWLSPERFRAAFRALALEVTSAD